MPTYFAGLRGSGNFSASERPESFREMILWMNPNGQAPLFALTSKSKTQTVNDPHFHWWEEVQTICRIQVNGALNDSATALVVDATDATHSDVRELIKGDLLMVEPATEVAAYTGEIVRVASVGSGTAATIVRAASGTTAAAIPDNAWLTRIGNAQREGGFAPGSSSSNPTKFDNYTQIFKTPYQITGTAEAIDYRTGDPLKNEQKRKSFQHSEKLEQALFWGQPSEVAVTEDGETQFIRTTRGIRSFITSNRTVFDTAPDEDMLMDALSPVFDYDAEEAGNSRLVFCGNGALTSLAKMVRDGSAHINYEGPVSFYGVDFEKYKIPQGTFMFKSHPLMNVHPVHTYSMFVMPGNGITWRPLKGRDTKTQKNIQPNDADFKKDQWLTEGGFEFHFERTWAYIGNFRR